VFKAQMMFCVFWCAQIMTVLGALATIAFGAVSNAAYWLSGLLLVMTK
jgi:hypothetical protein